MRKNSQEGIALIWVVLVGALFVVGTGVVVSKKRVQKIEEPQVEVSPTPQPSPSPTPEPVSERENPSPSPSGLPPEFLDWTTNKNWLPQGPGDIGKDIQAKIAKDMVEFQKTLSETPSQAGIPDFENMDSIQRIQQWVDEQPSFDLDLLDPDKMFKGLDNINKQAQEQIQKNIQKQQQEFQPIDPKKIEEYFNQNPPAVPHESKEFSPAEKEYYYRKEVLKDPAFQY